MSDIAIRAVGLGKQYRLGARQANQNLRETLVEVLAAPWRKQRPDDGRADVFWALKDVSFEVKRGEAVGIIGRNGAGKSTLLKILSRITRPTEGYAEVNGRAGSLLEVGTGFHPELTGRENIFLNGAILGMKRAEILRKFDEIVDFAEVEKFIDTAVKHYSSGMYVRLAFAVAAHLEPDILIVDEVLAVGDLAFQKKCLDRVTFDTRERGVTVLYVSHNMATVRTLCTRAVLLQDGRLIQHGEVGEVCGLYFRKLNASISTVIKRPRLFKSEEATIFDCWCEVRGERAMELTMPDPITFRVSVDVACKCLLSFALVLKDSIGQPFALAQFGLAAQPPLVLSPGRHEFALQLPRVYLAEGRYSADVTIGEPNRNFYDYIESGVVFDVAAPVDTLTQWTFKQSARQGVMLLDCAVAHL
jgi:lipopolysaccharide transport system ATP-binding protein